MPHNNHIPYIQRCLQLAKKGFSFVAPNPMVGCVIVYQNKIIGEGYHQQYGKAHAEVNAINSVKNKALLSKSTLYVNLEPCAHFGKTPPCSNLIIAHKIPRVVIGCVDTFLEVSGKGIAQLKQNGVEVIVGVLEKESKKTNARFFTYHTYKRPYIILKWAQSKDGFITPLPQFHNQKRWISNKQTQILVHKWRSEEAAILVGKNTVINDNPSLTVREYTGKNPIRIVIDKKLELFNEKEKYKIFNKNAPTIIFNQIVTKTIDNISLIKICFNEHFENQFLKEIYKLKIQSVLVEGGSYTHQSFLNKNSVDEIRVITGSVNLKEGLKPAIFYGFDRTKKIKLLEDEISYYTLSS